MPDIRYTNDVAVVLDEPERGMGDEPVRQADSLSAIGQAGHHSVEVAVFEGQNKWNEFLATLVELGDEASIRIAK